MINLVKYSLIVGVFIIALGAILPKIYASDSSWLSNGITLNEEKTYTLPQDISILDNIGTNGIDCVSKQIKISYTQNITACMYGIGSGYYGGGYLLFGNASTAGTVKSQMSTSSKLIFTANQKIVELVSSSGGYRVYIYDSFSGISTTKQLNGSITYTLPSSPRLVKNSDDSVLSINPNTFKLSENNQWAVADTFGYIGFVRINIGTGEVFSFTDTLNDYYSLNAISDDGMFASLSTQAPQKRLLVYDLSSCTQQSALVNRCKSSDLMQQILIQKSGFYSVVHSPKFINDSLLQIYGTYDRISPSNRKIGIFTVSPDGQTLTKTNYLALGDSFSSGEGIGNYRPETNFADNRCHQSTLSYGYLIHALLPSVGSFGSASCSGAKVKDVVLSGYSSEEEYNQKGFQAKNKVTPFYNSEIIDNLLPGYRLQSRFVIEYKPKIITMSMGGNDVGFSDILKKCVLSVNYTDCYPTYEDRKELVTMINNQYPRLRDMYAKLKAEAAPDVRIYIVGYPQIAKSGGDCALNVHFSENEITFGNQLVSYLNYVIKSAATDSGVFFVDTEHSFDGHKLCETSSDNVAVNGLTLGGGGPINGYGPIAKESYHPNALGHRLFADTINQSTNGLTSSMPVVNQNGSLVALSDENNPLLVNAPHTNRTLKTLQYAQNITTEVALRSALLSVQIAQPFVFKPLSSVSISLHSDTVQLGTQTTDQNGLFDTSLTLPSSVPAGYHTLYIEGKNMADEDVAVVQIIYVSDGTEADNKCGIVQTSGVDVDKDGVDDACDGFIDKAPPDSQPETPVAGDQLPVDTTQSTDPTQTTGNPQDQTSTPSDPPALIGDPTLPSSEPVVDVVSPEKQNDTLLTATQNRIIASSLSSTSASQTATQNLNSVPKSSDVSQPTQNKTPITSSNLVTHNGDVTKVAGVTSTGTLSTVSQPAKSSHFVLFGSIGLGIFMLMCSIFAALKVGRR